MLPLMLALSRVSGGLERAHAGLLVVCLCAWLLVGCGKSRGASDYQVTGAQRVAVAKAPGIVGRDGGFSFRAWGQSVWVFGDTVLSRPDSSGTNWHNNSLSFLKAFDPARGVMSFSHPVDEVGAARPLIPATDAERKFNEDQRKNRCAKKPCTARWAAWAGPGVWDAARQRALVFYQLVYAEAGEFNFRGVGSSIAVWESPDEFAKRPLAAGTGEHPTLMFSAIGFGAAALAEHGWLFSFGCTHDGWTHSCRLGRAPLAVAEYRSRWEFWSGKAWDPDLSRAAMVLDAAPMFTVAYNRALGKYTTIYSRPMSNEVAMRTAGALTGPWSEERLLFDTRSTGATRLVYDALAHPELAERDGLVQYISYTSPIEGGMFDARTVLVRVDLTLVGERPSSPVGP